MGRPPGARPALFDFLDQRDRRALEETGRPQRYPRGAWIIRQGDADDTVFILVDGRVKVTVDTADGRTIVVGVYGPGDVLGEFEALGGFTTRLAGVVAVDQVVCWKLSGAEFLDYLMAHPAGAIGLVRQLIWRLDAADRRRISGTSMDAPYALARFLIELADVSGREQAGAVELDVPLAQHELASMIGVSRNTLVRALGTLRARRLVTTTKATIRVIDAKGLRRFGDPAQR